MSFNSRNVAGIEQKLLSYEAALSCIYKHAAVHVLGSQHRQNRYPPNGAVKNVVPKKSPEESMVALGNSVGFRSADTITASKCTPEYDTSAMDGFAVCSDKVASASDQRKVTFRIVDSMAAGDGLKPPSSLCDSHEDVCVEIMTGARFPELVYPNLDAVVKIEDAAVVEHRDKTGAGVVRCIEVTKPVKPLQHRRPAGSDFLKGEEILKEGTTIEPKHIGALSSLGIRDIAIQTESRRDASETAESEKYCRVKIGIISTGSEIVDMMAERRCSSSDQTIPDSNGPYLTSSLQNAYPYADVEYLGVIADDEETLTRSISRAVTGESFDILISSGGVSKGRHDLIRHVVENRLGGNVIFHGVAMRPGAPVLFANFHTVENNKTECHQTAFFGAPGNPLAAAATLRFFVIPYVERLSAQLCRTSHSSDLDLDCFTSFPRVCLLGDGDSQIRSRKKPRGIKSFFLAREGSKPGSVEILEDQASYKLRNLLHADCWVLVPADQSEVVHGQLLTSCSL